MSVKVWHCVSDEHFDSIRMGSRPILPVKGTVAIETVLKFYFMTLTETVMLRVNRPLSTTNKALKMTWGPSIACWWGR